MIELDPAQIRAMRSQGKAWSDIAAELGVKPSTLRSWATRRKLTRSENNARASNLTFDDLIAAARENARILNAADPVTNHAARRFKTGPIAIIFVSCAHLGGRYTFYEGFADLFARVLDIPDLYWLSLGDDVEGFLPGFPDASAVSEQAFALPKVQRLMLAAVLDKLAARKKLLAGCSSNHGGGWHRKKTGDDPIQDLYAARNVPYFNGKSSLLLRVASQTYEIALAHEFPGSSIYNPTHAQSRAALFDFPNADVVVMGHKHTYAITEMSIAPHEYDAGLRPSYIRWLVQVGTAKTGPDRYSMAGWSRGVLEWPILVFSPDRHEIAATRDLAVAEHLLKEWT